MTMRCCYHKKRFVVLLLLVSALILLANRYYSRDEILQQKSTKVARHSNTRSFNGWDTVSQFGYVLTLEFTGQLVAGLRGIMSMQCWMGSYGLRMSIVEPYVVNSKLVNGINVWRQLREESVQDTKTTELLMLNDYFNMSMFNHASQRDGRSSLISWETFWDNAPRKLIVVTMKNPFKENCLSYTKAAMCKAEKARHDEKEQFTSGCQHSENVTNSIGYLKERGFKVVRTVCLNCESKAAQYFTPTEVTDQIFGEYNPSDVTLVISQWKFSFEMTPKCIRCNQQTTAEGNPLDQFSPSPLLLQYADTYIKSLRVNPQTKLVAIMIRIEWFLIMHRRSSLETVRECLSKVLDKYNQYLAAQPITRTVLALDIGKYGSGTFWSTLRKNNISQEYFSKVVEEIQEFVKEVDLDYNKWEESFEAVTNISYDRGYIALLQSVIVSKADYIIRMGGGHYQQLAMQLFLKNHSYVTESDQHYITDVCVRRRT